MACCPFYAIYLSEKPGHSPCSISHILHLAVCFLVELFNLLFYFSYLTIEALKASFTTVLHIIKLAQRISVTYQWQSWHLNTQLTNFKFQIFSTIQHCINRETSKGGWGCGNEEGAEKRLHILLSIMHFFLGTLWNREKVEYLRCQLSPTGLSKPSSYKKYSSGRFSYKLQGWARKTYQFQAF